MKVNFTKYINLLLLFVTAISWNAFSQQDAQYTNYMYNTITINPAYTGTRDAISVFGLHRTQWVGLDGAPVTNAFSAHAPVGDNLGLGVAFINDKIGPSASNNLSVDFAYRIPVGIDGTLSFGVKGTADLLNVDYSKLSIYDLSDPQFQTNVDNQLSPNVGAGIYWYSDKYYAGLSVPNFLETKHYNDNSASVYQQRMHYYLMAGYVFDLSPSIQFKPAFLTKIVQGAPLQLDVTANVLIHEKFMAGVAYRWDAAVSALAGFQITEKLIIGYSYDTETTRLSNYNSGSHEVFLRFELLGRNEKIYSPRFF